MEGEDFAGIFCEASPMKTEDFSYELPDAAIAQRPSRERTQSRLLVYREGSADIYTEHFSDLPSILASEFPNGTLLVRNQSAVLPCRLLFPLPHRPNVQSEILITSLPDDPFWQSIYPPQTQIQACCMIRHFKQWQPFTSLSLVLPAVDAALPSLAVKVDIEKRCDRHFIVNFSWKEAMPFRDILQYYGHLPLPPYMRRATEKEDATRYQTVYASVEGSVAAPTAGLHFSEELLHQLAQKKIPIADLCLHISTDTFQPIQTEDTSAHLMHGEFFSIEKEVMERLRHAPHITAIGTTALRTLESLYWLGCKACANPNATLHILEQAEPYSLRALPFDEAMNALLAYMDARGQCRFQAQTFLFIQPPHYSIRTAQALITNFHTPRSTLLLLIAAFAGADRWRSIYEIALRQGFRFLSYGDASLLIKTPSSQ